VRCLIIGCGCRGLALARTLLEDGHAVRGTTRDPQREALIAAAGVEPFIGDPDRVGTLVPALQHVGVVCVLLGTAVGDVSSLHGSRLEMLLSKLIDTTVRGVVYEAAGTVPADVLARGAAQVRAACETSRIPFALLERDPADHRAWIEGAVAAVDSIVK
jgi:NAD(P)-dependent dehydrogenase (short-subunit alcohol dehydrogenase family)